MGLGGRCLGVGWRAGVGFGFVGFGWVLLSGSRASSGVGFGGWFAGWVVVVPVGLWLGWSRHRRYRRSVLQSSSGWYPCAASRA